MNFENFTSEQIALMLHGLWSIYVADQEDNHHALTKAMRDELEARGLTWVDPESFNQSLNDLVKD